MMSIWPLAGRLFCAENAPSAAADKRLMIHDHKHMRTILTHRSAPCTSADNEAGEQTVGVSVCAGILPVQPSVQGSSP